MLHSLRYAFALGLQYVLPHITISRIAGAAARWTFPPWKRLLIGLFAKAYQPAMNEALKPDLQSYRSFSEFFTRPLKPGARPFNKDQPSFISPADGAISQIGAIRNGTLVQAKAHDYSVAALLGGHPWAESLAEGQFATIYLAPSDYHRVHMPCEGRLMETVYVPGRLFSVAPWTADRIPGLFARNERLVCLFENASGERFAQVLVGAMVVGGIETVWSGRISRTRKIVSEQHGDLKLERGEEMGRFDLGSTVIVLHQGNRMTWDKTLKSGDVVRVCQDLGHFD